MSLKPKEMLTDLMQTEKTLAMAYNQAELESANISLREALRIMQQEVQEHHAGLFHEMHQRGWYKTPTASQQAIESTLISWEQKLVREPEMCSDTRD